MPVLSNPSTPPEPATPPDDNAVIGAPQPLSTPSSQPETRGQEPPFDQTNDAPAINPDTASAPRRKWIPVVAGAAVLGAAAAGAIVVLGSDDSDAAEGAEPVTLRAVSAEQRDLVDFTDLDGRTAFADSQLVVGSADGTITDIVADGATVDRGASLYEFNATPVTVFYGDAPLYRPLGEGAVGDDVLVLEENLASLGYHTFDDDDNNGDVVDTGLLVDGVYDAATTAAVLRWQEDTAVAASGVVQPGDVVVVSGPAVASDVAVEVGSRTSPGAPVLTLNTVGDVEASYTEHFGEIDMFVAAGDVVASGDIVYSVDDIAKSALVTDEDILRPFEEGMEDGDDIVAIEEMLVSLGYDDGGDLTVDDEFDESTTQAITEWEEDMQNTFDDMVIDGVISLDEIIVFEPDTVVGTVTDDDGDVLATGTEMWSSQTDSAARIVETAIEVADQDKLTEGDVVDVEFPDGEIVSGTVIDIATSSTSDPMDPDADPTLAVEIELPSVPESAAGLNEVDVEVKLVDEIAAGATVVPVSALVAVGDGTYAVEALTSDGSTQFLAVEPGMFNDGFVEVSGIQPGTQVVVPS